MLGINILDTS